MDGIVFMNENDLGTNAIGQISRNNKIQMNFEKMHEIKFDIKNGQKSKSNTIEGFYHNERGQKSC